MRKLGGANIAVVVVLVVVAGVLAGVGITGFHLNSKPATLDSQLPANGGGSPTLGEITVPAATVTAERKTSTPLVSMLSSKIALLATSGCKEAASVEGTLDGGASFAATAVPVQHILRLDLRGPGSVWIVGTDRRCTKPVAYSTTDGAVTWTRASSLGQVWVPIRSGVRTPAGKTTTPCGTVAPMPVQLAPVSLNRALVLCQRGLFRTTDEGRTWRPTGDLPAGHPSALTVKASGRGVLLIDGQSSCAGLRVATTRDGGATWTSGQCLAHTVGSAGVALTSAGDGLVLSSGKPYTTHDFGKTWR